MIPLSAKARRQIAAVLLPALPTITAAASLAHGHGALHGSALGLIVTLCIAAGTWSAGLLSKRRSASAAYPGAARDLQRLVPYLSR